MVKEEKHSQEKKAAQTREASIYHPGYAKPGNCNILYGLPMSREDDHHWPPLWPHTQIFHG